MQWLINNLGPDRLAGPKDLDPPTFADNHDLCLEVLTVQCMVMSYCCFGKGILLLSRASDITAVVTTFNVLSHDKFWAEIEPITSTKLRRADALHVTWVLFNIYLHKIFVKV